MTQEQIDKILANKKIPLTLGLAFDHYALAWYLIIPITFCMFIICGGKQIDEFLLTISVILFIPALMIFFYFGPKQLKLIKIPIDFNNSKAAYIIAKETCQSLNWSILEENGYAYIKALRTDGALSTMHEIDLFIEGNYIYIISLYYPNSQATIYKNQNHKNVVTFKDKLNISYNK